MDAAAGSLDTSFNSTGKVVINAPGSLSDEFRTVVQADGKIVAAGYVGGDVAVARFNTDGTLDTSFDTDGIAITDGERKSVRKGHFSLFDTPRGSRNEK